MTDTPNTDRLHKAGDVTPGSREAVLASVQITGFLAVVEQLELLREEVRQNTAGIVDEIQGLADSLAVGSDTLGAAIQYQIDNRHVDYSNLADAIAVALEQRGVIR